MDELTRLAYAARHGRPRALEKFIEAGYPDVWRLCAALLDAQSAEDLAQETFLRATQALPRFRGESSARTWLLSIAHRVCIDELRARGRERKRDQRIEQLAESAIVDPDFAGEIGVRQLLARLDSNRRAAFVLTQLFRLSYEQAAAICECPPGTIRSRVARARDDLITELADSPSRARRAGIEMRAGEPATPHSGSSHIVRRAASVNPTARVRAVAAASAVQRGSASLRTASRKSSSTARDADSPQPTELE